MNSYKAVVWRELPLSWRWGPRLLGMICASMTVALPIQAANPVWLLAATSDRLQARPDATLPLTGGATNVRPPQAANNPAASGNEDKAQSTQSVAYLVHFVDIEENNKTGQRELAALFGRHPEEPKMERGPATDLFPHLKLPSQRNVTADRSQTEGQVAVLSRERFTDLYGRLSAQGVNLLHAPRVQTLAGRQARVSTLDVKTIVFDVKATYGTSLHPQADINYETGEVQLGPTTDIIPERAGDGWRLVVVAKFVEFLGYDDPGKAAPQAGNWSDSNLPVFEPAKAMLPRPHFRVRQTQGSAVANLGQTVALRGPLATETENVKGGFLRSGGIQTTTNRFYVFVTVESAQN